MAGYCKACGTMRSVAPCHKCGGPLKAPHPSWEEPAIPDVEPIRRLAREVGYALGVHGSLERDLDLIAAPWSEEAVSAAELAAHLARGLGGRVLAPEVKPLGRWSCNIQIDGWFKLIDLSVAPRGNPHQSPFATLGNDLDRAYREPLPALGDIHGVAVREGNGTERPVIEGEGSREERLTPTQGASNGG